MFGTEERTGHGYIVYKSHDPNADPMQEHYFSVGYVEEVGSYTILHGSDTSFAYQTKDILKIVWTENEPQ